MTLALLFYIDLDLDLTYSVGSEGVHECMGHVKTFAIFGCPALVERWVAGIWLRDGATKEEEDRDGDAERPRDHHGMLSWCVGDACRRQIVKSTKKES